MTAWDVFVSDTALNTGGTGVSEITGFGKPPVRDTFSSSSYGRDGEVLTVGGSPSGAFGFTVWWDDCDRDTGVRPADLEGRQAVALDNMSWVLGLVSNDYLNTVAIQAPGKSNLTAGQKTRTCAAQVVTMSDVAWNDIRTAGSVTMGWKIPDTYWRALGGTPLDASGWRTISGTGVTTITLPTDVHAMNGFIEDAVVTVKAGANPLKTITFKSPNAGAPAALPPTMELFNGRAAGLLAAGQTIVVDTKAFTALNTSTSESVYKFSDYRNGRPGTMFRIGPPYRITSAFTPVTSGASVADVTWSVKYRPSFY